MCVYKNKYIELTTNKQTNKKLLGNILVHKKHIFLLNKKAVFY